MNPLSRLLNRPRKYAYLRIDSRDVKMMTETLCVAQARIGNSPYDEAQKRYRIAYITVLLNELKKHRPTASNGKHGNLHTPTCGCRR